VRGEYGNANAKYFPNPFFNEETNFSERAWFFAKQKERGKIRSEQAAGVKRASPSEKWVRENIFHN
jgi:hypothetical protein